MTNKFIFLLLITISSSFKIPDKEKKPSVLPINKNQLVEGANDALVIETLTKYRNITSISFLGKLGLKSFYIDTDLKTQYDAMHSCEAMGMKLAEFDTQAEVNFVNGLTPKDYCWTAATSVLAGTSFKWIHSGQSLSTSLSLARSIYTGLVLWAFSSGGKLVTMEDSERLCYYCYQNTL